MNIAINSEASILIYRDGWYYLLVTHGSCCQGANSTYNIRMGRSRKVTGPYLDNMGIDMIEGGGKLFAASRGRHVGPGHFGLLDLGQGVQKFSLHYEADLDRGGVSVLDIRPLLWRDGWPVAGDNLVAGIYTIESARTGTVLELAVQGFPVGGFRASRRPPRGPAGSGPPPRPTAGATARPAHRRPGTCAGRGELVRDHRRATRARDAAGPAEMGDRAGGRCRRLSRRAVFPDHDRGHGTLADRHGGRRAHAPPHSRARRSNCGASTSSPMAAIASAPRPFPGRPRRWRCLPSAAACRRSRSSIPPAIASAGCWERRDESAQWLSAIFRCASPCRTAWRKLNRPRPAPPPPRSPAQRARRQPVDARGFIHRWLVLEPVPVPGRLTESAVQEALKLAALPRQCATRRRREGHRERHADAWHALDTI